MEDNIVNMSSIREIKFCEMPEFWKFQNPGKALMNISVGKMHRKKKPMVFYQTSDDMG